MVKPFDMRDAMLARHAQHVVLVHFPIALFISGVILDGIGFMKRQQGFYNAARWNFGGAALSGLPTIVTGILAWQFQLEGQRLKGVLLLHLIFGLIAGCMIWVTWWIHLRAKRRGTGLPAYRLLVELIAVVVVGLTGHLGGFLSGVNGMG